MIYWIGLSPVRELQVTVDGLFVFRKKRFLKSSKGKTLCAR